jgi:hypothetical protein
MARQFAEEQGEGDYTVRCGRFSGAPRSNKNFKGSISLDVKQE